MLALQLVVYYSEKGSEGTSLCSRGTRENLKA